MNDSIIQCGISVGGNVREYICKPTVPVNEYPTKNFCGPGSTMTVIDDSTHTVSDVLLFDGVNWNVF